MTHYYLKDIYTEWSCEYIWASMNNLVYSSIRKIHNFNSLIQVLFLKCIMHKRNAITFEYMCIYIIIP